MSYEALDRSNFLIARLRERYEGSVLYHEKGSSIGAFNSVSVAGQKSSLVWIFLFRLKKDELGIFSFSTIFSSLCAPHRKRATRQLTLSYARLWKS